MDTFVSHPYADIFPPMSDAEFAELKKDIAAHGQIEPIRLYEDKILDGRNRYRACLELGISPRCETFSENGVGPLDFVIAKNLKRRHLNSGQLAVIALEIEKHYAAQAAEIQRAAGAAGAAGGRGKKKKPLSKNLDKGFDSHKNSASEQAARVVGTNRQYVLDAKKVMTHAPELAEKVKRGEMSLQDAKKAVRVEQKKNELSVKAERFVLEPEPVVETRIAIYNRDARELAQFVSPDVDLVFTSPPYNVGMEYRTYQDNMPPLAYSAMLKKVFAACWKVMRPGARIGVNVPFGIGRDPYHPVAHQIFEVLVSCDFTLIGQTVWDKGQQAIANSTAWGSYASPASPRFRDRCEVIVWAYKQLPKLEIPEGANFLMDADIFRTLAQDYWHVPPASNPNHPAVFPPALVENALRFFGYEGCHILDPFAGTGSVGVAAKNLNCRASLVEIDAAYCQIAKERTQ